MFEYAHRGAKAVGLSQAAVTPRHSGQGRQPGLAVLRVGDGVLYHQPGGWATAGYYQSKEIISAFESAKVTIRLCAFGRILKQASDIAIPIDEAELSPCGVEVACLGILPVAWNWRAAADALRAQIRDADVIWAMLPSMLGLMAIEINGGTKPCVGQLVGDPRRSIAARSRTAHAGVVSIAAAHLVRRAISRADGAIFVSEALRVAYLADTGQRSIVANESRIQGAQVLGQASMAKVHRALEEACPSLVFAGRLSPEKGVAILLRALAVIPRVKLTIIGSGPEKRELEGMAERLGLGDRVCFLGSYRWGSDLLGIIHRHHGLVLPSFTEGLPLVLIEAMSQGVPVIASSVGGVSELVRDGVSGLLFPPGDAGGLAAAITRLISDPGLRYGLAEAGLRVAESHTAEVQYGRAANFILETIARRKST